LVDDVGFVLFAMDSASAFGPLYDRQRLTRKLVESVVQLAFVQSEIPESKPEQPVSVLLAYVFKTYPYRYCLYWGWKKLKQTSSTFGLTDWPGKKGCFKAVSVGLALLK